MEILLKQGDRLPIPEGCKAVIDGNVVLIEEKENEFRDGDVLHSIFNETMAIFREFYGYKEFRSHYNTQEPLEDSGWSVDAFRLATDEEKEIIFDKMKEQGLRWNAEEKKVEEIKWQPQNGEYYFFVNAFCEIGSIVCFENYIDEALEKAYNQFRTQEQTKKAAEVVKEALRKFHEENE